MTNQELEAALKKLAPRHFGTPPSIGDMLDNRLTPAQLRLPHCFSLSEVVEHNPALRDLVTVQGKAPTTTVLTTATGAFCPALFNDALQRLPLWLLSSPHLSDEEVFELTALQPTVIKHAPLGGYPEIYLAWKHAHYSVMFDPAQTGEPLDQAYDEDALLIGFAGGDTFGVKLITGLRDLYCTLQCANVCDDDDSDAYELEAAWENGREAVPDDIEFREERGPMDIGVGQHGEIAYVARVRQVNDAVLYISEKYRTASHKCACGCGLRVVTPLSPADWRLIKNNDLVSLHPSIGNWNFPCRSHYWIRENQIRWDAPLSARQIARVQSRDRIDKENYIAQVNRNKDANKKQMTTEPSQSVRETTSPSLLSKVMDWLKS